MFSTEENEARLGPLLMTNIRSGFMTGKASRCLFFCAAFLAIAIFSVFSTNVRGAKPVVAGKYAWQSEETGKLGSYDSRHFFAGYQFVSKKEGYATELCGFFEGTQAVDLFDASYNLLASAPVSSSKQWNCVSIKPVRVEKNLDYYVVGEMIGSVTYYRYQCCNPFLLPRGKDAIVKNGVTQILSLPFGSRVKRNPSAVFGIVDVKISGQTEVSDKQPEIIDRAIQEKGKSYIENCAGKRCVACNEEACGFKDARKAKKSGNSNFIQTCLAGECFTCINGSCDRSEAPGIKSGFYVKNCIDGKCVICLNGNCSVAGTKEAESDWYEYPSKDLRFSGFTVLRAWDGVWGGCSWKSCGQGGFLPAERNGKKKYPITIKCLDGSCKLCSRGKCVEVTVWEDSGPEGLPPDGGDPALDDNDTIVDDDDGPPGTDDADGFVSDDDNDGSGIDGSDKTPPIISNGEPGGNIGYRDPVLSVETDEKADCFYSLNSSPVTLKEIEAFYSEKNTDLEKLGAEETKTHARKLNSLKDGNYTYYVSCMDGNNNVNPAPYRIRFTVSKQGEKEDTIPPRILAVKFSSEVAGGTSDKAGMPLFEIIEATVTDNRGVKKVKAAILDPNNKIEEIMILSDSGEDMDRKSGDNVYSGISEKSPHLSSGVYHADIEAEDIFGNKAIEKNAASFVITPMGGWREGDDDPSEEEPAQKNCERILYNGSDEEKMNLSFVPLNYGTDMKAARRDIDAQIAEIFAASPLKGQKDKFNIYWTKVENLEVKGSNAKDIHDSELRSLRLEYIGFCYKANAGAVIGVVKGLKGGRANFGYGPVVVGNDHAFNTLHELGHRLFYLHDEYLSSCSYRDMSKTLNCENSDACAKWKDMPGTGCFKGCGCDNNYRPSEKCVMKSPAETKDFCPVCAKQINIIMKQLK